MNASSLGLLLGYDCQRASTCDWLCSVRRDCRTSERRRCRPVEQHHIGWGRLRCRGNRVRTPTHHDSREEQIAIQAGSLKDCAIGRSLYSVWRLELRYYLRPSESGNETPPGTAFVRAKTSFFATIELTLPLCKVPLCATTFE